MPIYCYSCPDCGLQFEKMQGVSVKGVAPCKRCGAPSERQVSVGSFRFAHQPSSTNPALTNTGASSVDHDVDVIIGRDSALRLAEMQKRQDHKRGIMRREGLETGHPLSRLPDGDYFVMSQDEQKAAKRARILNQEAMHRIQEFKQRQAASR